MQREEKQLDAALTAIIIRVNELKNSIASMIHKLETEYETINWPSLLDNYALLSGHLTGLSKILSAELSPSMRGLAVLPLLLSCERDEALVVLSEGRVPAFAHDLVPDYLRTKPEPQAEQRMLQLTHKASGLNFDAAQKQVSQFNKIVGHVWEIVSKGREDWEGESLRAGIQQTHSLTDTHALVTAVGMGKGLRGVGGAGPLVVGGPPRAGAAPPLPAPSLPKPPSAIKTNIKAATQIHPYQQR